MSGKIIYNSNTDVHRCSGAPGMWKRIFKNIGLGSHWQCDDCGQVWVLVNYGGVEHHWSKTAIKEDSK